MHPQSLFEAATSLLGLHRLRHDRRVQFTHVDYPGPALIDGVRYKLDGVDNPIGMETSFMTTVYGLDTRLFSDG